MVGVYFSGTRNTRHCVESFINKYEKDSKAIPIEDRGVCEAIKSEDFIVFGYPVYFSNLPKIVRDFIETNRDIFTGKRVFIIATMGLFSGDGTGCLARQLTKYGARIIGGVHIKMPDCIGDEKVLKRPLDKNRELVRSAERKLKKAADMVKAGRAPTEGLSLLSQMAGLFGQRLWFYNKTKNYSDKLKINADKCVGCGVCVRLCPLNNLKLSDENMRIPKTNGKCTMCYRCVNSCPKQAITLLGSKIHEQSRIEKYI